MAIVPGQSLPRPRRALLLRFRCILRIGCSAGEDWHQKGGELRSAAQRCCEGEPWPPRDLTEKPPNVVNMTEKPFPNVRLCICLQYKRHPSVGTRIVSWHCMEVEIGILKLNTLYFNSSPKSTKPMQPSAAFPPESGRKAQQGPKHHWRALHGEAVPSPAEAARSWAREACGLRACDSSEIICVRISKSRRSTRSSDGIQNATSPPTCFFRRTRNKWFITPDKKAIQFWVIQHCSRPSTVKHCAPNTSSCERAESIVLAASFT